MSEHVGSVVIDATTGESKVVSTLTPSEARAVFDETFGRGDIIRRNMNLLFGPGWEEKLGFFFIEKVLGAFHPSPSAEWIAEGRQRFYDAGGKLAEAAPFVDCDVVAERLKMPSPHCPQISLFFPAKISIRDVMLEVAREGFLRAKKNAAEQEKADERRRYFVMESKRKKEAEDRAAAAAAKASAAEAE